MDPETTSQENYDVVGEISPSNNYLDIHDDHTHADRHHIDRDANDIDRDDNQHASTLAALSALPKEVVRSETDERKKKKKKKKETERKKKERKKKKIRRKRRRGRIRATTTTTTLATTVSTTHGVHKPANYALVTLEDGLQSMGTAVGHKVLGFTCGVVRVTAIWRMTSCKAGPRATRF